CASAPTRSARRRRSAKPSRRSTTCSTSPPSGGTWSRFARTSPVRSSAHSRSSSASRTSSGSPPVRRRRTARSRYGRSSASAAAGGPRSCRSTITTARTSGPTTCRRSSRSCAMATELVLAGAGERDLTKLAEYEAIGGYAALAKARAMTPQAVIDEVIASELRGRGGAFFPTGRKWAFIPKPDQNPNPHYLVVNADESEPGSFKDNEIMARVPHRFIEGCLITAHAVESTSVFVYIRGEYTGPYQVLIKALRELGKRKELLGGVTIVVHRGAGAYICGEETALLESLEGRRGQPRTKPPYPAIQGLYASPTVVNNVETMATVPPIIQMGGAEYAKLGVPDSRGTRVVSISGHVERPGNYEIENGASVRELIYGLGGGVPGGRQLTAAPARPTSSAPSSRRTSTKPGVRSATRRRSTTSSRRSRCTRTRRSRRCRHEAPGEPPGSRMSAPETVKLTIDGVAVEVPKGTGLVEAAL